MHSSVCQPRRRRFASPLAVRLSLVLLSGLLAGCGGGGGGGGSDAADQYVGTWSGTMDQTRSRATTQLGIMLQFQKGSTPTALKGTLVETSNITVGGVAQTFVEKVGNFTGAVNGSAVTIDAVLHYDANGAPDLAASIPFHADLTASGSRGLALTGSWSQGANGGTLTISQTAAGSASLNAGGNWIGTPPTNGFTAFNSTTPAAFNLSFTLDGDNGFTNMSISTPVLGSQAFTATLFGSVGNNIVISGKLPSNIPPIQTPLGQQNISGLPFTLSGVVDSTGNAMTGDLQITLPLLGKVKAGTFKAVRQTTTPPGSPHILVADKDNNRIVSLTDITGAGFTTLGTSGQGTNQFFGPQDVTTDEAGKIYVADTKNKRLVRIDDMTGAGWKVFNVPPDTQTGFASPLKVHVASDGSIYYATAVDVYRISSMDDTNPIALRSKAPGLPSTSPFGVVTDSTHIYIVYGAFNEVARIDSNLTATGYAPNLKLFGSAGSGVNQFNFGFGNGGLGSIDIDSQGRLYVTDYNNGRIVRFNTTAFDSPTSPSSVGWTALSTRINPTDTADPHRPLGVVTQSSTGPLYYTDGTHEVVKVDNFDTGSGLVRFGTAGNGANQFGVPGGVAFRP